MAGGIKRKAQTPSISLFEKLFPPVSWSKPVIFKSVEPSPERKQQAKEKLFPGDGQGVLAVEVREQGPTGAPSSFL